MKSHRIHEIFYSLQGEGFYTGTPAVFVRFSGCNLHCPFCDTQHTTGSPMTEDAIVRAVVSYPAHHVVITGGEPSLFLTSTLVDALHATGRYVAVETNGTHSIPPQVDWVTLSPKEEAPPILTKCDELKIVYQGTPPPFFEQIQVRHRFLQPSDTGEPQLNAELTRQAIEYCKSHPQWCLSLQAHKLLHIP